VVSQKTIFVKFLIMTSQKWVYNYYLVKKRFLMVGPVSFFWTDRFSAIVKESYWIENRYLLLLFGTLYALRYTYFLNNQRRYYSQVTGHCDNAI